MALVHVTHLLLLPCELGRDQPHLFLQHALQQVANLRRPQHNYSDQLAAGSAGALKSVDSYTTVAVSHARPRPTTASSGKVIFTGLAQVARLRPVF